MSSSGIPFDMSMTSRLSMERAGGKDVHALNRKLESRENREELKKAAAQFEGMFLKMIMAEMDKTVERSDFLSGGHAEEMFRGMLFDHIAEQTATRPGGTGFGLAEAIYRQLESQLPKQTDETNGVDKDQSNEVTS